MLKKYFLCLIALLLLSTTSIMPLEAKNIKKRQHVKKTVIIKHQRLKLPQTGTASWYGPGFHGKTMANGQLFNKNNPTLAAHKTLKLGTRIKVTNLANKKSIIVRITDRGPYVKGRELDLSEAGAIKLGYRDDGTAKVKITKLTKL